MVKIKRKRPIGKSNLPASISNTYTYSVIAGITLTTHANHTHTPSPTLPTPTPFPPTPVYPSVSLDLGVESQYLPAIDQTHNRYLSDLQQQREEIDMEMETEIAP